MSSRAMLTAALLLTSGVIGAGWLIASRWDAGLSVERVAIGGDLDSRQRDRVLETLIEHRDAMHSLEDVRHRLTELEWVFDARVTRRWPDSITIEIVKETPIAWWNDDAFINAEGNVFTSPYVDLADLPQLYGPAGREAEVMRQYQSFAKALGRVDQSIDTLRLDERGSWQFKSTDGITVMLGKDDIMDRIQRFLFVVERVGLESRMDDIDQIDTRYPNGVAISWVDVPPGMAVAASEASSKAQSEIMKRETRL